MQKSTLKIMLLGEAGVGKTSLARRLVFDKFDPVYKATIGVDIFTYILKREITAYKNEIQLVIWDIDGEYEHNIFAHIYLEGANAALIVSDVTRPNTQTTALGLWESFNREFPGRPAMLVINKCDLDPEAGPSFDPQSLGLDAIWTSAKSGQGVLDAFVRLALACVERGLDR
jgi:small GTP-binding protein